MELPNTDTVKVIQDRRSYLIKKTEKSTEKNSYDLKEIKALDRVINLIDLFQNNIPENVKSEIAGIKNEEPVGAADTAATADAATEDYDVLDTFEFNLSKTGKLEVSFVRPKTSSPNTILLTIKRYKASSMKWTYRGHIQLSPSILEEILNKHKLQ